jgi:hypothetical protein
VQQKKESKLIKTKQSFNKIPDTHDNLHSQKPESVSESNDTNYVHTSQLEINRKSIHKINNAKELSVLGGHALMVRNDFVKEVCQCK